jgi:hypothetical protein
MPYLTQDQVDYLLGLTFDDMEMNDVKLAPDKISMPSFRTSPDEFESTACAGYVRQILIRPPVRS